MFEEIFSFVNRDKRLRAYENFIRVIENVNSHRQMHSCQKNALMFDDDKCCNIMTIVIELSHVL